MVRGSKEPTFRLWNHPVKVASFEGKTTNIERQGNSEACPIAKSVALYREVHRVNNPGSSDSVWKKPMGNHSIGPPILRVMTEGKSGKGKKEWLDLNELILKDVWNNHVICLVTVCLFRYLGAVYFEAALTRIIRRYYCYTMHCDPVDRKASNWQGCVTYSSIWPPESG